VSQDQLSGLATTALIILGVLVVTGVVALLVPSLRAKAATSFRQARDALQVLRSPYKLLQLYGGNLLSQLLFAISSHGVGEPKPVSLTSRCDTHRTTTAWCSQVAEATRASRRFGARRACSITTDPGHVQRAPRRRAARGDAPQPRRNILQSARTAKQPVRPTRRRSDRRSEAPPCCLAVRQRRGIVPRTGARPVPHRALRGVGSRPHVVSPYDNPTGLVLRGELVPKLRRIDAGTRREY
jgi:hypothetical protein